MLSDCWHPMRSKLPWLISFISHFTWRGLVAFSRAVNWIRDKPTKRLQTYQEFTLRDCHIFAARYSILFSLYTSLEDHIKWISTSRLCRNKASSPPVLKFLFSKKWKKPKKTRHYVEGIHCDLRRDYDERFFQVFFGRWPESPNHDKQDWGRERGKQLTVGFFHFKMLWLFTKSFSSELWRISTCCMAFDDIMNPLLELEINFLTGRSLVLGYFLLP